MSAEARSEADKPVTSEFSVVHTADLEFGEGLRPYLRYKDLGLTKATGGRYMGANIRSAKAFSGGTGRHKHVLDFQFVFVLKGTLEYWFDGQGTVELKPGSAMHAPGGLRHDLLGASEDAEWIEITSPAEIGTIDD